MKKVFFYFSKCLFIGCLVFVLNSCKEEEDIVLVRPPAPTNVKAVLTNEGVKISWDKVVIKENENANIEYYINTSSSYGTTYDTEYVDKYAQAGINNYTVYANYNGYKSQASETVSCELPDGYGAGGTQTGIYMGVIGFNENINARNISLLTNYTKNGFQSFVNEMTAKAGTVLYYSVDDAINRLQVAKLPDDLVNVSIVTFTDGLDQGSLALNSDYQTRAEYRNYVQQRIRNEKINGLDITAYSIGIKGNDVTNTTEFTENLISLASATENATEVANMTEVNNKFSEIATSLYYKTRTLRLTIPVQENGAKIRFTFDNVNDAEKSKYYIEGIYYSMSNSLQNVAYNGIESSSGTTISGTKNGIFVTFPFSDLVYSSGGALSMNYIKQWSYEENQWQVNSEFSPSNTETVVDQKSVVIMLVLDCSSSLGTEFSRMQSSANNFINVLLK